MQPQGLCKCRPTHSMPQKDGIHMTAPQTHICLSSSTTVLHRQPGCEDALRRSCRCNGHCRRRSNYSARPPAIFSCSSTSGPSVMWYQWRCRIDAKVIWYPVHKLEHWNKNKRPDSLEAKEPRTKKPWSPDIWSQSDVTMFRNPKDA